MLLRLCMHDDSCPYFRQEQRGVDPALVTTVMAATFFSHRTEKRSSFLFHLSFISDTNKIDQGRSILGPFRCNWPVNLISIPGIAYPSLVIMETVFFRRLYFLEMYSPFVFVFPDSWPCFCNQCVLYTMNHKVLFLCISKSSFHIVSFL
ncbi:hypothetical protein BS78_10G158800 [Paspalum vaginatum]|nr:hypothetical protein BS78_10G158800 [Paspalum vaginatum]